MKLIGGTIDGLITEWSKYQYNGSYSLIGCRAYTIPIYRQQLNLLYWYIELSKVPSSISFKVVDVCNCTFDDIDMNRYMIGTNTDGNYYVVMNDLQLPVIDTFVIAAEVLYADNTRQWFFSQSYQIEEACIPVDLLYACYGPNDNGGYDQNGIYYGLPVTTLIGDPSMRYFHNYSFRGLAALYSGRKNTYTAFANRPTKTESETIYSITHEIIPYWYEEFTAEAYARGIVFVNNFKYRINEYQSSPVGDACCERLQAVARGVKTFTTSHGCVFEICVPSTCVAPDVANDFIVSCSGIPLDVLLAMTGTLPITLNVIDADGMSVALQDNSIRITGTPTTNKTVVIELENCGGTIQRSIQIQANCCVPSVSGLINLQMLPSANLGAAYNQSYTVNGTPVIDLNVVSKPAWMTISLVGDQLTFSGTATTSGVQNIQINLSNECGSIDLNLTVDIKAATLSNWSCLNQSLGTNTVRVNGNAGDVVELEITAQGYFNWSGTGVGAYLYVSIDQFPNCAHSSVPQTGPNVHNAQCQLNVTIPPAGFIDIPCKVIVSNGTAGSTSMVSTSICVVRVNGSLQTDVCINGLCVGVSTGV